LKTKADGRGSKLRPGAKRGARNHGFSAKAGVDAIAAAYILEGFLDSQHSGDAEES